MNAQLLPECQRLRSDGLFHSPEGLSDKVVISHLDKCADCREFLSSEDGKRDDWEKLRTHLQPTEFDLAGSDGYSAASMVGTKVQRSFAIPDVLDSLRPTDDPHKLGRLGSYEITGVIGVGGMGVVLKAVDPSLDRVVAVKVMAPALANNDKARKRFSREAKAAAAVLHPNVVPIHSVASDGAIPYLVMAYVRGGSLQKRIENEGPLSVVEILRIGSQISAGLAAAHEQGLVHRDIKPENVLLEEGVERVTITDFGLARAVDDNTVTQNGTIAGTPMYMSPEQARGEKVEQASDLFSLGCVMYALCTGQPPYTGETSYSVMRKIIDESPDGIQDVNPDIPDWLVGIVQKLMAKDKADRFDSAADVHRLMDACLSHVQQPESIALPVEVQWICSSTNDLVEPRRPAPKSKSGRGRWLTTLIGLGLAGCIAASFLFQNYQKSKRDKEMQHAYSNMRGYLRSGNPDRLKMESLHFLLSHPDGYDRLRSLDEDFDEFEFTVGGLPQGLEAAAILLHHGLEAGQRRISLTAVRENFSTGPSILLPRQVRVDSLELDSGSVYDQKLQIQYSASTEDRHRKTLTRTLNLKPGAEYTTVVTVADIIQDRVDWIDIWKEGEHTGVVSRSVRTSQGYESPNPQTAVLAIRGIMLGLETKKLTDGDYPTMDEGLQAVAKKQGDSEKADFFLIDPWGHRYGYENPGQHGSKPDVWSVGPDGKTGTGDDICSWALPPETPQTRPGVEIVTYDDQTKDTHLWKLKTQRVSDLRIRLIHISNGNVLVASESQLRTDGDVESTIDLKLDLETAEDNPDTVTPTIAVSADGVRVNRSTGTPVTVSGPFQNSPTITGGGLAWDEPTILFHRCIFNGDLTYSATEDSMVEASKRGAEFLAVDVEWVAEGALDPPGWARIYNNEDVENIQGTWKVVFVEDSGRAGAQDTFKNIRFVFADDRMTTEVAGRKSESTFTLDPSTNPKSIDLTENGRTKPGIYDLQGNTMRICISEATDERPTVFDSQPDSPNDLILTLKRVK